MKLTAIVEQGDDGWLVGQIAEFPAALAQGKTIDELKTSLLEAFWLLVESEKQSTLLDYDGRAFITEELTVSSETKRFAQTS